MRLPDFIVIGAAKAGTTSLCRILSLHPHLFISTPKEPEFFARDDKYEQGIDTYARLFDPAAPDQICGEGSTLYSLTGLFPQTPERLFKHVPKAKIIYVLREPVKRSFSYYVQLIKNYQNETGNHTVSRSFEDCLSDQREHLKRGNFFANFDAHLPDQKELFTDGSLYLTQIEAYLKYYPRQQMHFLKFEDLISDPAKAVAEVCAFLQVDIAALPDTALNVRENISSEHFQSKQENRLVEKTGALAGPLWILRKLLPQSLRLGLRRLLTGMLRGTTPGNEAPKAMKDSTKADLKSRFHKDLPELSTITGLDLRSWR